MADVKDKDKKIKKKNDTDELRRSRIDNAKAKMSVVKGKIDKKTKGISVSCGLSSHREQ